MTSTNSGNSHDTEVSEDEAPNAKTVAQEAATTNTASVTGDTAVTVEEVEHGQKSVKRLNPVLRASLGIGVALAILVLAAFLTEML